MSERERTFKDKVLRNLSRRLTEQELLERRQLARQIAQKFSEDKEWKDWITGIILFGSILNENARTISDIDLAIITEQRKFFGLDYSWITRNLNNSSKRYAKELGFVTVKIHCTLCPQAWLENPYIAEIKNPEVFEKIKCGEIIYTKPKLT